MIICPAQPFDIFSIMSIERQSFIPAIQEKKRVFERRLRVFPEGFLVLADCSDDVILRNRTALVCGYLCAEKWDSADFDKIIGAAGDASHQNEREAARNERLLRKRFALGHNLLHTHKTNGSVLYISSLALLKEYRGKGLGEKFFVNSVAALCASLGSVKKIVLLVNSEWKSALRIYEKWGFVTILALKEFFPTLQKKVCADGIIMEAPAERFRAIQFSGSEDAIKI